MSRFHRLFNRLQPVGGVHQQQQARSVKQFAAARMQKRLVSSVFRPPAAGGIHRRLRMGEELQRRRGCKKSSFIGSSTACIRWSAPATDELQRSGCKKSSSTGFSTACSRWCAPASEKGKELQRSAKRERERKRRGKRQENVPGICIAVTSFLK